ncbi:YitT family protein [Nesterenkonia populi]
MSGAENQNPPSGERERSPRPLASDPKLQHTLPEDILGVLVGTYIAGLGLYILEHTGAVTGGTAGLALLLTYATPLSVGPLFVLVNLPFYLLAWWRKGWKFTVKTIVSVAALAVFTEISARLMPLGDIDPVYGTVGGNFLLGVALIVIFRHGSSLGGFNIVALIAQEQFGLRAGYVQMCLDVTVVLLAFTVIAPPFVALSVLGAVTLNIVLAFNHRPGRYRG